MILFADASALVAMIVGEADADDLANRMARYSERLCSALSAWETIAALRNSYVLAVPLARSMVYDFLDAGSFAFVPIGRAELEVATAAYAKFGRGRHLAALNMGDCFAYACTKTNGAHLLYKGNDFSETDINKVTS